MGDFDLFTNIHVRNYFELKRSGEYEKALQELQIACDQEDGQGWYIIGRIREDNDYYQRSALAGCPWGMIQYALSNHKVFNKYIEKAFSTGDNFAQSLCYLNGYGNRNVNIAFAIDSMRKACKQNNPFVIDVLLLHFQHDIGHQEYTYWLKHGAKLGIPGCLCKMGERYDYYKKEYFEWHLKAHLQKYNLSTDAIAKCYYYGGNESCKLNKLKGIKLAIEADCYDYLVCCWLKETNHLQALFVFGRELLRHEMARIRVDRNQYNISANPIRIYQESIDKARRAVFCFLLCSRGFLVKDVRQMIGKMIWKFRKDPEEWGAK